MNRSCPECGTKLRSSEYSRNRQSYLTSFECPNCKVSLKLAPEIYLWFFLVFQFVPFAMFKDQMNPAMSGPLETLSSVLLLIGVVGVIARFRYIKA